ncbi:MAG: exodeoxyribonuclease III [Saccharofermentanales bacterium]
MKFISWNIDSVNAALTGTSDRALLSQEVLGTIRDHDPEIIALQETKLPEGGPTAKHLEGLNHWFPGYRLVWNSSQAPARTGYAGTLFLYKEHLTPTVEYPLIGAPGTMDREGRIITLEFDDFFLTQVYTPNAGEGLARLQERQVWDRCYASYLADLDSRKQVVATGDFNVAHKEIDLANPESNRRSAGFTDEERQGFSDLLARGFTDTFRHLHGDVTGVYSWWAQRARTSKINNAGWRIDYWLVSDRIKNQVRKSEMIDSGPRQDHTPVLLELDF